LGSSTTSTSVGFAFGCVTEALVVPPVRAGTNPQRWELKCIDPLDPEKQGNLLGAQGWELAAESLRAR
jgi:hypothetical protein